jgi:hypothetical protein
VFGCLLVLYHMPMEASLTYTVIMILGVVMANRSPLSSTYFRKAKGGVLV